MATALAIAALVHFESAASAQSAAPVLWLGELTEVTETNFVNKGVAIQAVDCAAGDTACVAAKIDAASANGANASS